MVGIGEFTSHFSFCLEGMGQSRFGTVLGPSLVVGLGPVHGGYDLDFDPQPNVCAFLFSGTDASAHLKRVQALGDNPYVVSRCLAEASLWQAELGRGLREPSTREPRVSKFLPWLL